MADKRIQKEYQNLTTQDNQDDIKVQLVNQDYRRWKAYIKGPDNSCYENGVFEIDIVIPPDYPYKPPKMQFSTKIWHPNVSSQTGMICLDILKDEWSPALSIRTSLLSIQALMCSAEPSKIKRLSLRQRGRRDVQD